jgi:hypothetical protein
MDRITDAMLDFRLNTANSLLGFSSDVPYPTPGTLVFYKAYGSTGVHLVDNEHGGQRTMFDLGTKREAFIFLGGFIQALRITLDAAKVGS